jgi:hypothetical protein
MPKRNRVDERKKAERRLEDNHISWKGRGKYSFKTKLTPPPLLYLFLFLLFFFYPIYEKGSFQRTRYVVCV